MACSLSFPSPPLVSREGDSEMVGDPAPTRSLLAACPWRQLGMALVAFVVTYALAANIPINWHGYVRHVQYITSAGSVPYQEFTNTVFGHIGLLSKTLALLARSLSIPALQRLRTWPPLGTDPVEGREPRPSGPCPVVLSLLHRGDLICVSAVSPAIRAHLRLFGGKFLGDSLETPRVGLPG